MTALGFYSGPTGTRLTLAGEGCFLKVFETESAKLICLIKIFEDQTIHGIVVQEDENQTDSLQVAIWGGYSLALFRKQAFEALLCQKLNSIKDVAILLSDWVLDVAISPYDDSCVAVTAHNTVFRARLEKDDEATQLEMLNSPSRSILYSAHLVWDSPTCVLVAAGTVFGEIIAWECSISNEVSSSACRVLATLTGHEGSIFGVNISPPIAGLYDKPVRLLASCSDDRTIRVWDIRDRSENIEAENMDIRDSSSLRETGFGSNVQKEDPSCVDNRCLATAMGHVSRIWSVKFQICDSDSSKASSVRVFSFGEDSTVQQWALDFGAVSHPETNSPGPASTVGPNKSGKLSHLTTFAFHCGKHIWSTAMQRINHTRTHLITGGADGKISSYDIPLTSSSDVADLSQNLLDCPEGTAHDKNQNPSTLPQLQSLCLEDVLDSITAASPEASISTAKASPLSVPCQDAVIIEENGKPPKKVKRPKEVKDAFNRYAFVSDNIMLVTTNFGRVFLGHVSMSIKWEELPLPESGKEDLKSYSVIKGIPQIGVAFLAGANGHVYIYRSGTPITRIGDVGGKVADIFALFDPRSRRIDLGVSTLGGNTLTMFTFDQQVTSPLAMPTVSFQLLDKFIVTSVGKSNNVLVFGGRNGSLAIYDIEGSSMPVTTWTPKREDNLGDAITSITSIPSTKGDQYYFLTTGRSGIYSIFAVTVTQVEGLMTGLTVCQIHRGTPPFGPNIESGWFEGPDLILYGFKSKKFIVWNETRQFEIIDIDCGGAHRSHAYSPLQNGGGGHFIYTKASKLHVHSWQNPSHQIIKPGGHGREIKTCAISTDKDFIATGAEDTALRIWRYSEGGSHINNQLQCLAVIQKHTSGIQYLQWYKSKYLFSSAGNEEFFIWAVEDIPGFGMGIVCEASTPDPSEERDLRIMSFDVTEDTQASGLDDELHLLISMAYSDSIIRTYRYSRTGGFELLARGRYTSSCLMQIHHIKQTPEELYLLTTATDGNLTIWKTTVSRSTLEEQQQATRQLSRLSTHKLHQNSVKCLDLAISSIAKNIIVATGGDDNALGITVYKPENLELEPESIILRSAHAAAITGLCFMPRSRVSMETGEEELRITSSSNDQRVKEWSLKINQEGERRIKMVGDIFTSVADVGDVGAFHGGDNDGHAKVLVVGNGMGVYSVSRT